MKHLLHLSILCLLLSACQKVPTTAVISGQLEFLDSDHVYLYKSSERYSYKAWLLCVDTSEVSVNGDFSFSFDITEPDFYQIANDKGFPQVTDLYLTPGDSIFVNGRKVDNRRVYAFKGARAGAYAYSMVRDSLQKNEPLYAGSYRDVYRVSEDSAAHLLNRRLMWESDLIDTYFDGHPDWQPIADLVQDQRNYAIYEQYFAYLYYYNYYVNDTFIYVIPDPAFYDFMKDVDLTSCPKQYLWEYQSFIKRYVEDRMHHDYADLPDSLWWANNLEMRFETVRKYIQGEPHDAAMLALTDEFSHAMSNADFYAVLANIETYFESNHTAEHFLKKFLRAAEKFKALKPGQPAPDIALPDINGDTVRLSDLKGKVLYVDFWGTWCYPCLLELPHSLELQEKLKDENVEFVYIGLEGGEDQVAEWEDFVSGKRTFAYAPFLEQREYPGVHLLCKGQFGNPEIQSYMINSAPTYLLIDAAGNIAQGRAPRPSDPDIEGIIRELLTGE